MAGRRIFLAIDISDTARDTCVRHVQALRSRFPNVRVGWERFDKMHVTLKFLGDTTDEVLRQLVTKIGDVASGQPAFSTSLASAGLFPNQRLPRIIWIGIRDPEQHLTRIHQMVDGACLEFGYELDAKRFTPHITVGRVREPRNASALARAHMEAQIEEVRFRVSEIVIYESKLQSTGSVYAPLANLKLG